MFPGEIRALGHVPNWLCYILGCQTLPSFPVAMGNEGLGWHPQASNIWCHPGGILESWVRFLASNFFLWTSSPKYRLRTKHPFWFEMPLGMVMMMLDQTQTPKKIGFLFIAKPEKRLEKKKWIRVDDRKTSWKPYNKGDPKKISSKWLEFWIWVGLTHLKSLHLCDYSSL